VTAPPVLVLGVRRSGTTLLRVMLDRHSSLAIPDESYFIPQLADRHRRPIDVEAFVDDLRRLPTLREWDVDVDAVRARLRDGMVPGDAIAAVYETYAAARGKRRWGDKTPMYMQRLPLLERLFPTALYVHVIRDGRDSALSFASMPEGIVTRTWAHPQDAAGFACQWRTEVTAARKLGARVGARYLEVRYEALVAEPEQAVRKICAHAKIPYEPAMLDYAAHVDVTAQPHQQSLTKPPTPGLRNWRTEMREADVRAFEAVAGDLLAALGYETRSGLTLRGRLRRAWYAMRITAWNAAARALRVSPLWRRGHPPL
jgi:LPS sulfotransferase NodH